jgi:maltooligosyltrehalose trehalohydrolase
VPMLFMGEEFASTTPVLFFTDHHNELADAVRTGRRNEFRGFSGFKDEAKLARIPDPNAPSSFAASVPEPTDPAQFDWMRNVISLRRRYVVPGIPDCRSEGATVLGTGAVRAEWKLGDGSRLMIALNLGTDIVDPKMPIGRTIYAEGAADATALGPNSFLAQLAQ